MPIGIPTLLYFAWLPKPFFEVLVKLPLSLTPEFLLAESAWCGQWQDLPTVQAIAKLSGIIAAEAWVPGWQGTMKIILENIFPDTAVGSGCSPGSLKWVLNFTPLSLSWSCWFLGGPQESSTLASVQSYSPVAHKLQLSRTQFYTWAFLDNLQVLESFSFWFLLQIIIVNLN